LAEQLRPHPREDWLMKKHLALACIVVGICAVAMPPAAVAQQNRMKECADQWNKMKAAKQTAGKTYKDFSKECMSQGATAPAATPAAAPAAAPAAKPAAAPAAAPAAKPAAAPAAKPATPPAAATPAKPADGRAAMVARERACGADWKADKAAGKVPAGMTWPKYWSECNTRKKAQGM
jgi:hypothetical protein